MGSIIRGAVMFDDSQRQLDPQDRQPPALPTISPLRIALRTRRTSPHSTSRISVCRAETVLIFSSRYCRSVAGHHICSCCGRAGVFGVKLRIVMGSIIRGAVMFDDSQRQLDPQDRLPPALPTTHDLSPEDSAQDAPHLATIAKRFSAVARTRSTNARHQCRVTEVKRTQCELSNNHRWVHSTLRDRVPIRCSRRRSQDRLL